VTTTITKRIGSAATANATKRIVDDSAGEATYAAWGESWGKPWADAWAMSWRVRSSDSVLGHTRRSTATATANNTKRVTL
jgi:hypothetical protein